MGITDSRDQNIDTYIEVLQPSVFAGQFLQGNIHINCKAQSNYAQLCLRFLGKESLIWTQSSQVHTKLFDNVVETYNSVFSIYKFPQKMIPKGQYSFPFKILLPQGLAGSFHQAFGKYIRYSLICELEPSNKSNRQQMHQQIVHIIEPLRVQQGPITCEKQFNPKLWNFFSYGNVGIVLTCDKNYVRPNDKIKVTASIDNTNGQRSIQNIVIKFMEKSVVNASNGQVRFGKDKQHILIKYDGQIQTGLKQNIIVEGVIPKDFSVHSTAIGSIIAKYFNIVLSWDMGTLSNTQQLDLHLVYHADSPKRQKNIKVEAPKDWKPKVFQILIHKQLQPYIYRPLPTIPHHNRSSKQLKQIQTINSKNRLNDN